MTNAEYEAAMARVLRPDARVTVCLGEQCSHGRVLIRAEDSLVTGCLEPLAAELLPYVVPAGVLRVNWVGGVSFVREQDEGATWVRGWTDKYSLAGRALLAAHALAGPGCGRAASFPDVVVIPGDNTTA